MKTISMIMVMMFLVFSPFYVFAGTSDKECKAAVKSCAIAAKKVKLSAPECKPLRDCKQVCRGEKRVCKTNCRDLKKTCKDNCKSQYGKGKDYRECKKGCRNLKKECKQSCKTVKTGCKQECRLKFKTPECREARKEIAFSILKTIPACIQLTQCINRKE